MKSVHDKILCLLVLKTWNKSNWGLFLHEYAAQCYRDCKKKRVKKYEKVSGVTLHY